jgi:hypothetical protein
MTMPSGHLLLHTDPEYHRTLGITKLYDLHTRKLHFIAWQRSLSRMYTAFIAIYDGTATQRNKQLSRVTLFHSSTTNGIK